MRSFKSLRNLSPTARTALFVREGLLSADDLIGQSRALDLWTTMMEEARLSENIFGSFLLPYAAVLMRVNGRDRVVPIATEEAGIAAGMSKAAKLLEDFRVDVLPCAEICGEALVVDVPDAASGADGRLKLDRILSGMFSEFGRTEARPRGLIAMDPPVPVTGWPKAVQLRFRIDPGDAMGAKMAIRIAEAGARAFASAFGGRIVTAIITNQLSGWAMTCEVRWPLPTDDGSIHRALGVVELCRWAGAVPSRAVTHNKGVMNGIIAAATAFSQDTRAIEASAASMAYLSGACKPLTSYAIEDDVLVGRLEKLRLPIGTVGGSMKHPLTPVSLRLAGIEGTADLTAVLAAAGMAANFASLFQLAAPEGFSDTYRHL